MIIAFVLLALMALGVVAFLVLFSTNRAQKKAETNADRLLDETFDGRPDVTYTLNMRTLKYGTVVTGAKQRGYKLVNQAENQYGPHTLIFEKA